MEPRKIQKVGYSTLSVSIPMNWAKKRGIRKGDLIFISQENDGSLRLTTELGGVEDNNIHVINVDLCDNTKVLERVVVGNYVLGRNVIKVESSRRLMREHIESIRNVTQRLLGIGIIEEDDRHLLLQCSIDPKNFPLHTVVRRLYRITSIMFKETIDSLVEEDMELAKDAVTREHEADTIYWLLVRLLAAALQSRAVPEGSGISDPISIVQNNLLAWFLEMIGDRIYNIASNVIVFHDVKDRCNGELVERLSQIGQITFTMFDKALKSIFDGNLKIASDAIDLHETVEKEERSLLRGFQDETDLEVVTIVSSIACDLRIISEYSSNIAEIAIDNVLNGENEICQILRED